MSLSTILRIAFFAFLAFLISAMQLAAQDEQQSDAGVENRLLESARSSERQSREHSKAAEQLLERIRENESTAEVEAEAIRQLNETGSGDAKLMEQRQRKLKTSLASAFDLKLQFEELQVKELKSRLSHFEQQIRQRKELRDKIVDHRANQLIEKIRLQWESNRENQVTESAALPKTPVGLVGGPSSLSPKPSSPIYQSPPPVHTAYPAPYQEAFPGPSRLPDSGTAGRLQKIIDEEFPKSSIKCRALEGGAILLTGEADQNSILEINDIAHSYAPTIINHLRVAKQPTKSLEAKNQNDSQQPSKAGEDGAKNLEQSPTVEQMQEKLKPFADRFTAAVNRVRGLETTFFRDHSGAEQLQKALKELSEARREFRESYKEFEPLEKRLNDEVKLADLFDLAAEKKSNSAKSRLIDGNNNHAELKQAISAREKAAISKAAAQQELIKFQKVAYKLNPGAEALTDVIALSTQEPLETSNQIVRLDVARELLERRTGTTLELVRCDALNLWFKTALQVRKSIGNYHAGDLIVLFNGHLFNSWDQAVQALNNVENDRHPVLTFLKGGLTGSVKESNCSGDAIREPNAGNPKESLFEFEIRVKSEGTKESQIKYASGACLSPEGLVVVPISFRSLAEKEEIVVCNRGKATAQVVAADDEHGLILLKVDMRNKNLFRWLKCRETMPIENQKVNAVVKNVFLGGTVLRIGLPYPEPLVGKDAFVVTDDLRQTIPTIGTPLVSLEGSLQGLSIEGKFDRAPETEANYMVLAIPAIHAERLLNNYLRTQEK